MNSTNWIMWVCGGANGIWVSFVAPWTHKMYCHSLAMQEHGVGLHSHLSNHSGNVIFRGMLFWLHALTKVKNQVCLLVYI